MVNGSNLGRKVCYGVIVHMDIKNGLKISIALISTIGLENSAGKYGDFRIVVK